MTVDGLPMTDAQPPFLLRYSPQLFAKEAPEMFAYDSDTNRLSLREGKAEPWLRPAFPNMAENDPAKAEAALTDMCEKLLANTVIENYQIHLDGEA